MAGWDQETYHALPKTALIKFFNAMLTPLTPWLHRDGQLIIQSALAKVSFIRCVTPAKTKEGLDAFAVSSWVHAAFFPVAIVTLASGKVPPSMEVRPLFTA